MRHLFRNINLPKIQSPFLLLAIFVIIIEYGFDLPSWTEKPILLFYAGLLAISVLSMPFEYIFRHKQFVLRAFIFDVLNVLFILFCLKEQYQNGWNDISSWLRIGVVLKIIRELIPVRLNYKRSFLDPAQLFVLTFLAIIFAGALLLMLPHSTYKGISFIDALFTSTSAVCVTGLTVVDTGAYFTPIGQMVIMLLIQAGGLGILTFTSFFSYFFLGGTSFESQLALGNLNSLDKQLGSVFSTLKRILGITLFVEAVGAALIYFHVPLSNFSSRGEAVFFAVFHAVSAFCNAGFSIIPDGLVNKQYVFDYPFQLTLIGLLVFGGIGFPIVINVLSYLKYTVKRYVFWFLFGKNKYQLKGLTVSSKINLITTLCLIVFGTGFIFFNEYDHVLSMHHGFGKLVTALFTATTPRTAGFSSIDFGQLHLTSILVIILLMWIGASPASTGGGIKTSTFAIAILNFVSIAKGKRKIEVWKREIADGSVRRAFAVMALSLILMGISILLLASTNPQFSLRQIAFECFSAFSTAGLTMGITPHINVSGEIILIADMFIGRVTLLTLLMAFMQRKKRLNYRYPTEEILIN